MDTVITALADQQAELSNLLDNLGDDGWRAPTRCVGWDIADVVLHLAQTDEVAIASATGRYAELATEIAGRVGPVDSIDDGAEKLVDLERDIPTTELRARWSSGAARLLDALDAIDSYTRVMWVTGEFSARTLATARLAETWIHTGDVASGMGIALAPTDRLRLIARLAWRTLPYAFAAAGRSMTGPVAFRLESPRGEMWDFLPDGPALTTITGRAEDLCSVAGRRIDAAATSLRGHGPDYESVVSLVRTYA